jgi:hypothetical protein
LEWWWPNAPSGAELIIPTLGDFADYEARKGERLTRARLPPAPSFDRYMTERIWLSFMEAARVARAIVRGNVGPFYLRVPDLTEWAFHLMAEWAEDADDARRVRLAKTRLPLALGLDPKRSPEAADDRQRILDALVEAERGRQAGQREAPALEPPRRQRKPSPETVVKRALKRDIPVKSYTVGDVTLHLAEPDGTASTSNNADAEVDAWIKKHAH